ncbi:YugN-like family protein [Mechercharimyces sp. CAU 1602]|uniref:YugN-like family protein n=1 Tax=Mechercharimyces sp. CAU 1602 TaxID=2973933 RepID=UPI002163E933|nr:YugN-like family protein [Mechercharimyces sp. CAU 1602]MCS1349973.1 YugN-like family protein [Mechercharimyces sp. CAU 1602]
MKKLNSRLENHTGLFGELNTLCKEKNFSFSPSDQYEHGYFDKELDWEDKAHQTYLRIPIYAEDEGRVGEPKTLIRFGQPLILRHLFQTDNDDNADIGMWSGLVNQFTEPAIKDAEVEKKWIDRGQKELRELEEHVLK